MTHAPKNWTVLTAQAPRKPRDRRAAGRETARHDI
jgi:hypothetical protein